MSKQRPMTMASVKSIMNGRTTVPASAVGKRVRLLIQGSGNVIDVKRTNGELVASVVEPGTVLQKKIFNVKSSTELGLRNARNIEWLKVGVAAEKAGDVEGTDEAFTNYLNATQLSFGVLLPSTIVDQLANGVEIAATVIEVETEAGKLLTIDPSTIAIQQPEVLAHSAFNIDDFLVDVTPTGGLITNDKLLAMDRPALLEYIKGSTTLKGKVITKNKTEEQIRADIRVLELEAEEV